MAKVRITSDGTPRNTKVIDVDSGVEITNKLSGFDLHARAEDGMFRSVLHFIDLEIDVEAQVVETLYLCGRVKEESWDFQGVFDNRDKAVAACRDHTYFIYPFELNRQLPHETMTMAESVGFEFPLAQPMPPEGQIEGTIS